MKAGGILAIAAIVAMAGQADAQRAKREMGPSLTGDPGTWFSPDAYPPEAIRAGRSGRVVVDIAIDTTGTAISCQVKVSSGTEVLDNKTCEIALKNARFDPATDRKGRPIASHFTLPVRWVLPEVRQGIDISNSPVTEQTIETELTISADGIVIGCRVITQNPAPLSPEQDACRDHQPGTDTHSIVTKNGQPVSFVLHTTNTTSVKPLAAAP